MCSHVASSRKKKAWLLCHRFSNGKLKALGDYLIALAMFTKKVPHQLIPLMMQCPVPPLPPCGRAVPQGRCGWGGVGGGAHGNPSTNNGYQIHTLFSVSPPSPLNLSGPFICILYANNASTLAWGITLLHQSSLNWGDYGSFTAKVSIFAHIANKMEPVFSLFIQSRYAPLKNRFFLCLCLNIQNHHSIIAITCFSRLHDTQ